MEGVEGERFKFPKARSPYRLGGLRERRKFPKRGLGQSPRNRRNFDHFMPKWSAFLDIVNLIIVTGSGKSRLKSLMIKQQKLAEMPFRWKIFNFNFWHISLNKMLYYMKNVII